jgi:hypothetical protein
MTPATETVLTHREAAAERLEAARKMCDAAANQSYLVQAEATRDLLTAEAVAREWGVAL